MYLDVGYLAGTYQHLLSTSTVVLLLTYHFSEDAQAVYGAGGPWGGDTRSGIFIWNDAPISNIGVDWGSPAQTIVITIPDVVLRGEILPVVLGMVVDMSLDSTVLSVCILMNITACITSVLSSDREPLFHPASTSGRSTRNAPH